MYQVKDGKVSFVVEKFKVDLTLEQYSCNCNHGIDVWDTKTFEFLEYHVTSNHMIDFELTCPRCRTTIIDAMQKVGYVVECIECEVKQFIGGSYINVFMLQDK